MSLCRFHIDSGFTPTRNDLIVSEYFAIRNTIFYCIFITLKYMQEITLLQGSQKILKLIIIDYNWSLAQATASRCIVIPKRKEYSDESHCSNSYSFILFSCSSQRRNSITLRNSFQYINQNNYKEQNVFLQEISHSDPKGEKKIKAGFTFMGLWSYAVGKPAVLKLKPNFHSSATSNALERIPFFTEVVCCMFGWIYYYLLHKRLELYLSG